MSFALTTKPILKIRIFQSIKTGKLLPRDSQKKESPQKKQSQKKDSTKIVFWHIIFFNEQ